MTINHNDNQPQLEDRMLWADLSRGRATAATTINHHDDGNSEIGDDNNSNCDGAVFVVVMSFECLPPEWSRGRADPLAS